MAVGFNAERGDAISVEPLSRIMTKPAVSAAPASTSPTAVAPERPVKQGWWPHNTSTSSEISLAVAILVLVGLVMVVVRRRAEQNTLERRLSARERQQLLTELKSWLEAEKTATGGATNR
jgi:flagellar biosynthesis/type III secretory pathway M-ring protein FliF/YscJ